MSPRQLAFLAVFALSLSFLARPVHAGFAEGLAAFEQEDYERAVAELLPLARAGRADAMVVLARAYDEGLENIREALPWYQKAAAKGNAEAQTRLGLLYDEGIGVAQDTDAAMAWYAKAAAQGDDMAELALGRHHADDLGDNAEALRYFRRAAEQGNLEAQYRLGLLYLGEPGVPRNVVQAWLFLSLASEQYEEAARAGDVLELEMKAADVRQAQKLLETWQKGH